MIVGVAACAHIGRAEAAEVTMAWDPVDGGALAVSGYKVYYDDDGPGAPYEGKGATEGASPITIPSSSFADAGSPETGLHGLTSCQHYWFAVTAFSAPDGGADSGADGGVIESGYSNEADTTPVASPNPVTVTLTSTAPPSLEIAWQAPPPGDPGVIPKYVVHYATHSGKPYDASGSPKEVLRTSLADPAHPKVVLSNLPPASTYYVAIEAVCGDGATKLSDEASSRSADDGGAVSQAPADAGRTPDDSASRPGNADAPGGSDGGCSCRAASASPALATFAPLALVALAVRARRRRPQRAR